MTDATHVYDDGGRKDAGHRGRARDCVVRSIAIALELPYERVRGDLNERAARLSDVCKVGVDRDVYEAYLAEHSWAFKATMGIGTGCRVHLRADELPSGRIIARTSRHLVAVIDGVVRDTHDPTRGGKRCVYGYYSKRQP
jgi:hypothetical protein